MYNPRMRRLILAIAILAGGAIIASQTVIFSVLKSTAAIGIQGGGYYLLPTNQLLRPWGEQARITGRPVDLTFDSQKRVLAILNSHSVLFMDGSTGTQLGEAKSRSTSYTGLAFRPGDRELW